MTPEAALTKLSYVLGKSQWDIKTKREMLQRNLRGELTKVVPKPQNIFGPNRDVLSPDFSFDSVLGNVVKKDAVNQIVQIVANSLGLRSPEEVEGIKGVLAPSLSCALVAQCSQMKDPSNNYLANLDSLFGTSVSPSRI